MLENVLVYTYEDILINNCKLLDFLEKFEKPMTECKSYVLCYHVNGYVWIFNTLFIKIINEIKKFLYVAHIFR